MEQRRGSRRHVLEWLDSPAFLADLNSLIASTGALVTPADSSKPLGTGDKARESEARLGSWGPKVLAGVDWDDVRRSHDPRGVALDFGLSAIRHACMVCGWDPALAASAGSQSHTRQACWNAERANATAA